MSKAFQILETGGPVMYLLTIIAIMILTTGLRKIFWLSVWSIFSNDFSCSGAPRWSGKALEIARNKNGFAELSMLDSLEICFSRTEDCLTRSIPAMRFFAQISTLMGFLGTVTGMVKVFNTVSESGSATPANLAGGIYEALFTTVYGLTLAIIAWGFVWLIETMARHHVRNLEIKIIEILEGENSDCKGTKVT